MRPMGADILSVLPGELKFPLELRKQVSCSLQLVNNTESFVAFKVKTTSPKKYCVRPNTSVIPPGASCDVIVTMQAQRDLPPDMQCKDKFLVQSVIVDGDQPKEVSQDLFNKAPGKEVYETKLKVVYVAPPQPPSPVAESAEEGVSPRPSLNLNNSFDSAIDHGDLKAKLSEMQLQVARLANEKEAAMCKSQQLQEELVSKKKSSAAKTDVAFQAKPSTGFSFLFVLTVGLLGVLVGYFLRS